MKRAFKLLTLLIIALTLMAASCARMPTTKRSVSLIKSHFKSYGKKFPKTPFGKNTVKEVEITGQKEIHKHLISVEAFVTLKDGSVERINATLEKGPLGWRFISWENATGM